MSLNGAVEREQTCGPLKKTAAWSFGLARSLICKTSPLLDVFFIRNCFIPYNNNSLHPLNYSRILVSIWKHSLKSEPALPVQLNRQTPVLLLEKGMSAEMNMAGMAGRWGLERLSFLPSQ